MRRHDVGRDAAFDEPDGVVRAPEQRILGQRDAAKHHQRVEQLVDRRLAELGKRRMRGASARAQPHAEHAARREPEAVVGRLAVDRGTARRPARGRWRHARRRCRALRPTTNSSATRDSPAARSRSAAATCAARMPFASHEPRPNSSRAPRRLGKNGGTQSKCVEKHDARRRGELREHVEAAVGDRLLADAVAARRAGTPTAMRRLPARARSWNRCRRARA